MKKNIAATNVADIPVVILCGGKGTRLREETENVPKPLVRIGERPILWHILKIYHAQGFRRFVLLLGYKGERIKEYLIHYQLYANSFTLTQTGSHVRTTLLSKPQENWEITCLDTGEDTMTGGRIKQLEKLLARDRFFMLTYGDGVANVDLKKILTEHLKNKKSVTMTGVPPIARFGEIRLTNGGTFQFFEKPATTQSLINGGFMAVNTSLLKKLPSDPALNFEVDVLTKLAAENDLHVVPHQGFWQCMDTVRDMELLNAEWDSGTPPWKIWQ
jgi:glucose-1-phosphate cytidylyltransferase